MTLKMSERDKWLLLILAIVVVLIGSIKLFTVIDEAATECEEECREANTRFTELNTKYLNQKKYKDDTQNYIDEYNDGMAGYYSTCAQSEMLVFLGKIEKDTGVWLNRVGLSETTLLYTFGQTKSTNPAKQGKTVYNTDAKGYSTLMTLAYECTYDQLKDVLDYIDNYKYKCLVNNMAMTYSESTQLVTGTFDLTVYSVLASDRDENETDIKNVPFGTTNIFSSSTFKSSGVDASYRNKIINDHDLYLILNPYGSDMDTFVAGITSDPTNETAVSATNKIAEDVTIRVSGTAGAYRVSYRVGDNTYPEKNYANGESLVIGDSLDLLIISQARKGKEDVAVANVTLINESDTPLNVAVINDDAANPRFILAGMQGNVVFYNE